MRDIGNERSLPNYLINVLLLLSNSFFFSCCCRLIYCADEKINFVSTLVFSRARFKRGGGECVSLGGHQGERRRRQSFCLSLERIIHSLLRIARERAYYLS
jgi:hypothetical protein